MKKQYKKSFALLLALVLSFLLSVAAQAANYPAGLVKSQNKTTPWGTMTGSIYYATSDEWTANPERLVIVETKINSSKTMAEVKAEVECQDNATGETHPSWQNTSIDYNTNLTSTRVHMNPLKTSTIAVFTNHEVTYTSSENFYMSYLSRPVQE